MSWERFASRWTTLAVCVGEGEASLARHLGLPGPSTVVRSGVDLARFRVASEQDRRAAREALCLPQSAPVAVCMGRVTRQKGQDLLAAAWPRVRAVHPDAVLAMVGDGSLPSPVPPGVRLAGPTEDPWTWYAAADVIVFPSPWEGLPLTLLEALAVGRSIVGTDIPGIAEVLPADAGALVPLGDEAALADAVALRLGDTGQAGREGDAGRAFAERAADIRRTHDRLAALVDRVANGVEQRRSRTS